jgi:release factor glutamine methyltransferase
MFSTRAEALCWGTSQLRAAGIESPRLEARLLLAYVLGIPQEALIAEPGAAFAAETAYRAAVTDRAGHAPLAYILGYREFWSLRLAVSPATLIPRPDTESLVAAALARCAGRPPARLLDLGTGTGCLLLALLSEWPASFGVGVDRVEAAARLAAENSRALGLAARAAFVCADWASALHGKFDLVVANPPYIPTGEIPGLMPEVAAHEAASALDGGADGLAAYRLILAALPRLLTDGARAILEFGSGQAESVTALAQRAGFFAEIDNDLSGMPRMIVLRRGSEGEKTFGRVGTGR